MIGTQILNYDVVEKIGEGGFATVYLGKNLQMDQKVAIKVLHNDIAGNAEQRARFLQEAKTLSALNHKGVVRLLNFTEAGDSLAIIMEHVQGTVLKEIIAQNGPMPQSKAIPMFAKILAALGQAHEQGLVHRDIKPANVIITEEGEPMLLDFGIAKPLADLEKTVDSTRLGSPMYMSPEQVMGKGIGYRSDIYAAGVLLWYMLSGKPPYDEKSFTRYDLEQAILKDPLPPLSDFVAGVSESVQAAIDTATAKSPDQRFQSTAAMRTALQVVNETMKPLHPLSDASEIPKRQVPTLIIWIAALIIAGGLFTAWQVGVFDDLSGDTNSRQTERLQHRTELFFKDYSLHDKEVFRKHYALELKRYYQTQGITRATAMQSAYNWWGVYPFEEIEPDWKTIAVQTVNDGGTEVKVDAIYKKKKKKEDDWVAHSVTFILRYDTEDKLYYIDQKIHEEISPKD